MKRLFASLLLLVLLFGLFSCKDRNKPAEDIFYQVEFSTSNLPYEAAPPEKVTVKAGESIAAPEFSVEPTAGYVVIWTRDVLSKTPYDFSATVSENFILYAVEVPRSYRITYLIEKGRNDSRNPTSFTKATEDVALYPIVSESLFGYRFLKWAYFDDPESDVTAIEQGTETDIILRAVFEPVTYNVLCYDTVADSTRNFDYVFGTTLSLEIPEKGGYRFVGYTIRGDQNETPVTELTAEFVLAHRQALTYYSAGNFSIQENWERTE